MYTYSVLPLDVMTLDLQVEDCSSYELQNLKLNVATGQQNSVFEVIGNGGFGSIYKGTVLCHREHIDLSASANEFKGVKRLGSFHGVLLEKAKDSSLSQLYDCAAPVEEIMVAVKQISSSGEVTREDLDREARTMRVFWGRRNFAAVYGLTYCKQLQSVCIVMEVVSGCNLNQFLCSRGTAVFNDPDERTVNICDLWRSNDVLWWIQKLSLFREIVLALMLCHGKKVYHGDLKGDNILLDKQLIPKLIDFGLSFQRRDIEYLSSLGGSLFWVAPEVIESGAPQSCVLADPFPSDVYSLGMLLFEILLDGKIPDSFTDSTFVILDKYQGFYPVSLDVVQSDDSFLSGNVIGPLKGLVDKCCEVEREKRISLQNCLSVVEKVHSDLFSRYRHAGHRTPWEMDEDLVLVSPRYKDMMRLFHDRFPDVHDYLVLSPSWNMVISEDGALLVHRFCCLDFLAGVQYIVEKSTWDFQAERDIPHMSLLCVENESLSTLEYIAASWGDVLRRQPLLIHKACNSSNLVMFKLLLDIGIDFDTWVAEEPFMKPIHQLAAKGKTEFLRCLMDHPGVHANYVNTASPRYGRCYGGDNTEKIKSFSSYVDDLKVQDLSFQMMSLPDEFLDVPKHVPMYYAVVEDRVDTVKFLLQRGGMYVDKRIEQVIGLIDERSYWLSSLLHLAHESFSIGVVLELQYTPEACISSPSLDILRRHVDDVALSSPNKKPMHLACQKGKEKVFEAALDLVIYDEAFYIIRALMFYIARGGSKEMVDIIIANETLVKHYFTSEIFSMRDVAFLLLAEGTSTNLLDSPHSGEIESRISVSDVAAASGNTQVFQHILESQQEDSGSDDVEDVEDVDADSFGDLQVNGEALELSSHLEAEVISMHFALDNPYDLALYCCRKGHVGVLKFYEDCGLDLDAIRDNEDKDSILHSAVDYAHIDMVKYLLERGFLVDSTNWILGETPLQHACSIKPEASRTERRHMMDIASLLLKKGADPNYVNQGGYTAMDQAMDFKDKQMVRFLVDHGFDVGPKDRYGKDYMTRVASI